MKKCPLCGSSDVVAPDDLYHDAIGVLACGDCGHADLADGFHDVDDAPVVDAPEQQEEDEIECDACGWTGVGSEATEFEYDGEFLCPECGHWSNT